MSMIPVVGRDSAGGLLLPTYAEITQYGAGQAPTAPAAGKTRLYADSAGGLQLLPSAGAARRVVMHWGSGTAFPASPAVGDAFVRTDIGTGGTTWIYGVNGWRCEEPIIVADAAARALIPPAAAYAGMQVTEANTGRVVQWDAGNARWSKFAGPPESLVDATSVTTVTSTAANTSAFQSNHSVALAAHLPGMLRIRYSVLWNSTGNAATFSRTLLGTVVVPGSDRTHNNGDTLGKNVKAIADGYIATDGTAKTVFGQNSPDSGGNAITMSVAAIQVWQV